MGAADDAIAAIFYVSAVLLGKYVLLNLLVAILVENYSSLQGDEGDKRRLLEDRLRSQSAFVRVIKGPIDFIRRCLPGARPKADSGAGRASNASDRSVWAVVQQVMRGPAALRPSSFLRVESLPSSRAVGGDGQEAEVKGAAGAAHGPPPSGAGGGGGTGTGPSLDPLQSRDLEDDNNDDTRRHSGTANAFCQRFCLGCARGLNALDEALLRVYEHDWFPFVMIVAIMVSCVVLALDCPGAEGTGPGPLQRIVVQACEALFIGAMTFEQVYRVKSLGGIWTYDGSYLTRLWDWFDLFVILSSLIALCIPYPSVAAVAVNAPIAQAAMAAKVARGFRPITLIPRINGLTVVVDTLGQALRACSGVLSVLAVFYLLFGILGVSLFSGVRPPRPSLTCLACMPSAHRAPSPASHPSHYPIARQGFYSCNDPERTCFPYTPGAFEGTAGAAGAATSVSTSPGFSCPLTQACVGKYYDVATASMVDREWRNPTYSPEGSPYSFDSLPTALLTLFEVASLEMWGEIMFTACDVVGPGRVRTDASLKSRWKCMPLLNLLT